MTDPFSIVSGIAGILSVAVSIVSSCYKYSVTAKGAASEIQDLLDELTSLMGVLTAIKALIDSDDQYLLDDDEATLVESNDEAGTAEKLPQSPLLDDTQLGILEAVVKSCKHTLDKVMADLTSAQPGSKHKLGRSWKVIMWPFRKEDILSLTARLGSYKSTLSCALSTQNLTTNLEILDVVKDIYENQNQELLRYRSEAQGEILLYHLEKARGLTQFLGSWMLRNPVWHAWLEAERTFLWLYGIPGSGKTVLLWGRSTLLEQCLSLAQAQGTFIAYYYCDFRDEQSQRAESVVGSLICQICRQLNGKPTSLLDFAQSHSTDNGQLSTSTYRDLEGLLLTLLDACPSIIIAIDGLDECHNRESILSLLVQLPLQKTYKAKVLVTSRVEEDIRTTFAGQNQQSTRVHASNEDINLYISNSIAESSRLRRLSPALTNRVKDSLSIGANGMFQWVRCQIEELSNLRTDRDIRQALNHLPPSLDTTYERILSRVKPIDYTVARRALTWLAFAARPLKVDELTEAIVVENGSTTIDPEARWRPQDLLSFISSLVIYPNQNGTISLAHHSIKEYLLSTQLAQQAPHFHLTESTSNVEIATTCLTYLLMEDFASGATFDKALYLQRHKRHPLFDYASRQWPSHARKYLHSSPTLQNLAYTLLRPTRPPQFQSWLECLVSRFRYSFQPIPENLTPLYYAASFDLVEIVKRLLDAGAWVDEPGSMYGGTPLHGALSWQAGVEVVEALLNAGANVLAKDVHGCLVLSFARSSGSEEVKKAFVSRGFREGLVD